MKKFLFISAVFLLGFSAFAQIQFEKTGQRATFIDGDDLIVSQQPGDTTVRTSSKRRALTYEEMAENLSAVMVDTEGNVYEGGISADDLALFEEGIRLLELSGMGPLTTMGRKGADSEEAMMFVDDQERIVHGADGRRQVGIIADPYVNIGRISVGCTGTLIGPKHVLTAGHCVSDGEGNWYSSLKFSANQLFSFFKPFGTTNWDKAITTGKWHNDGDSNYDYAMIVLKSAPHGGYASFGVYSDGNYTIAGYPGDKPTGTLWEMSGDTWSNTYKVFYDIDTAGGQSGSGVRDGNNVVRGIHAHGYANKNGGIKISNGLYNSFTNWIAANP